MEQNENTLSVLKIAPGQYPQQVEIDPDLKSLQQAVGGNIGASYPFSDPVAIVYNDEGKLMGLPLKRELTLSDERIEKAITQNGARLIILDPIQAYMGEKTDMNRANEVRPMFRRLADVAERTGCAVILIGHLNKAAGGQSAYRGLGSIDFRAAARSVLLIGRVKREPNVRVIVHDKSSLAPEGKPVAFCLDPETGFSWIGEYDITADELLSGAGGNTATKTEQAERLILDLLADGKELASEDIVKAAAEAGISERTVQNAKRNMGGILGARRVGGQWYNFIKKKQPPEPAS